MAITRGTIANLNERKGVVKTEMILGGIEIHLIYDTFNINESGVTVGETFEHFTFKMPVRCSSGVV